MSRNNQNKSSVSEFPSRLRDVRIRLGMNQKEFADKIGASPSHISELEKGASSPSRLLITAICNTFFINPKYFDAGEDPMFVPAEEAMKRLVGPKYQMLSDLGFLAREANLDEIPEELLAIVHNLLRIHRHQWVTIEKIVEAFCNQVGIEYERPGREQKKEAPELEMKEKAG